jgi:integrase
MWIGMWEMQRRRNDRLSAAQVKALKARGFYCDGDGLYLQVSQSATKSWVFRYAENGKTRYMGLGSARTLSLTEAREAALAQRKLRLQGLDPIESRTRQRQAVRLTALQSTTFGECAEQYLESHEAAWPNAEHRRQWRSSLTVCCEPLLDLPVGSIDTNLVLQVLAPIWKTHTVTASRVRGRIERLLAWAKGRGLRDGENPARWGGHLDEMLPAPGKITRKRHHPAMPYCEVGEFMAELRGRNDLGARPLEFLVLTAARTGEVVGATWDEIDLNGKRWTIPPHRMKAGREHCVPLSGRALDIVQALPHNGALVFNIFEAAMRRTLLAMRSGYSVHGLRATFRTWASEQTNHPWEVCESALAHNIGGAVERAYARGSLYAKRARLMQAWGAFCGKSR